MKGAIDIHVHGYPDALVDTGWDFAEICRADYDAGMRAICCKSMYSDTAPMAYFVQQMMDEYAKDKGGPTASGSSEASSSTSPPAGSIPSPSRPP